MRRTRAILLIALALIIAGAGLSWYGSANAQKRKAAQQKEVYTRPKPKEPIKPEIPDADRYQEDKVFLEYADSLFRPSNELEEYQIVKGSVKFRHGNMWMYCDSAYYYPNHNSMNAFGHVKMEQGDTLFVYSDRLYYDGMSKHATLVKGPSRGNVELKNRSVTLTTDSLDYDLNTEQGWYTTGGKLEDNVNTLTSQYGEYSPRTKEAKFRDNVLLVNRKDGYRMITEELDYNTDTHIANINTKTRIEGAQDTIETTQGWYDTTTDHAQLTARSIITHRDSSMNVTWLEGDSIIYDKQTRKSRAYMFRDNRKLPQPMVITDTARKVQLIGGYGEYDDLTSRAMATEYPLLIEFSRPDTLFLRADTVMSFMRTEPVWPDSLSHEWDAETRERFKSYIAPQDLTRDMELALYVVDRELREPGFGIAKPEENAGPDADSDEDQGEKMTATEVVGTQPEPQPEPGVPESSESPASSAAAMRGKVLALMERTSSGSPDSAEPTRRDSLPRLDKWGRDSNYMVPKEFRVAKAIGRARFFNQDMQGVADTIIFQEYDSLLHLIRKPIVWNENRQVMGPKIVVHFNDSTPDWALLPNSGIMAEHIESDFYNQLSGNVMKAWITDKKIRRMDIDGNVQTIFLPQESDSTYNKMVNAESSFLSCDFIDGKMDHLRMWPEVTGIVSPLGDVKKSQRALQGFAWKEELRPVRQWYGDRWHWADDLGEVPDALDRWFREPEIKRTAAPDPETYKGLVR